jgi:hypothetical protein
MMTRMFPSNKCIRICPLCDKEVKEGQQGITSRSGKMTIHSQCALKLELQEKHGRGRPGCHRRPGAPG